MPLPDPYISNVNGTSADAFRISDSSGANGASAIILDNNTAPGTLALRKGSDGTTLMKLQVGAPSANDDVATKNYVDTAPTANAAEQILALSLAFNSSSPVTSGYAIPNNAYVTKVQVQVTTAFDGTGGTVSVGYTGQLTKYMPTSANNLKVKGVYNLEQYTQQTSGSGQQTLLTYVAPTGATAGAATVLVWFVIIPKV